jgi:hypothetical protein
MKRILLILTVFTLILFSGCEKELSTSPEEVLLRKNGLIVESNPAGAKIYINGKNTGQVTPDTLFWLNPGSVVLTLKMDLFKDSTIAVNIQEEDTTRIFLDYTTNKTMFGKLYITSNPSGAEIFLNDSLLNGRTPFTTSNMLPGYYNVKYKLSGYWDEVRVAGVKSVATVYVDQQLIDTLVWINYTSHRTDIPSDYLSSIAIDGHVKWIGSLDAGLIRFDDKEWTIYNMENSVIPDNMINDVKVDNFGNVWICTNFGVVKKNGDFWTLYNTSNSGLPDDKVLSVDFDGSNIYFGTMSAGLVIYDGINWTNYNKDNSLLPSNMVNDVLFQDSILWACTYDGLAKITSYGWKIINMSNSSNIVSGGSPGSAPRPYGFPNNNCKTITIDKIGKPWIGFGKAGDVPGGSSVLRVLNIWKTYHSKPSPEVFSIAVDNNNIKWFGSSHNGLSKFDGTTWTHYHTANSKIKTDRIYGVAIDGNGHKWMASYGAGLIKYKGN